MKKSIVYSGDPVNTASRIVNECKKYKKEILVSADLLNLTELPSHFAKLKVDTVQLRGKSETISLFTVIQK